MAERPEAAPPAADWTHLTAGPKDAWMRVMGRYHLHVEKQGHDWWEIIVTDGPIENDQQIYIGEASGLTAAQRRAELIAWHRERAGTGNG